MENPELTPIIGDSSGLVSLVTDTDDLHEAAVREAHHLEKSQYVIIVPADVFTESMNILGRKSGHDVALRAAHSLLSPGGTFSIVDTSEDIRRHALAIFREQPASVSYTDCVVMAFADAYATKRIFGFDRAFRTAGYELPSAESGEGEEKAA